MNAWQQLPEPSRSIVAAIKGELPAGEFARLDADLQKKIQVMRRELAKPESQRFQPDPASVQRALEAQLGLSFTPAKRTVTALVVEAMTGAAADTPKR